jgi:hypothetical protein
MGSKDEYEKAIIAMKKASVKIQTFNAFLGVVPDDSRNLTKTGK